MLVPLCLLSRLESYVQTDMLVPLCLLSRLESYVQTNMLASMPTITPRELCTNRHARLYAYYHAYRVMYKQTCTIDYVMVLELRLCTL